MRRMVHITNITVQNISRQYCSVHFSPHVGAMIHVILLRHEQLFVLPRGHGCQIYRLVAVSVEVPFLVTEG